MNSWLPCNANSARICDYLASRGTAVKLGRKVGIEKYPTSAVEAVPQVVDYQRGSGKPPPLLHSPCQRVETRIDCAGCAATLVKINGTESNDGAERPLPRKRGQAQRNFRIRLEFRSFRTGRGLVLVDHQRPGIAHAVVAQPPGALVVIGSAGKGLASQHQEIPSALQELFDFRPGLFRKRRAVGQHQKRRGRRNQ
jgi:hypothetical protein